ncbi:hypothetical protein SmaMPs15_000053 [Stenotrophomonas maltophilia phage vB_SmaM_Ps15]|uniref:Uncharacterized protein n=1 Tax=Stenotrophomonas maltophilia phage vB_SmaM_Ps15 TaxID=3071007 RepID=A0AAE9FM30_9CAUD|nr:hypothetical protein PQC01_gp053 [Stenotrophomonas maltophilia phage vB_SmaM_Ps15]UMO77204.1 hypothetical protein SmaMPs15_000053 [Stenotrophomonas maltophilia phage vB_SmaM_Ps15]
MTCSTNRRGKPDMVKMIFRHDDLDFIRKHDFALWCWIMDHSYDWRDPVSWEFTLPQEVVDEVKAFYKPLLMKDRDEYPAFPAELTPRLCKGCRDVRIPKIGPPYCSSCDPVLRSIHDLKRYDPVGYEGVNMEPMKDGQWVRFSDVQRLMEAKL